MGHVFNVPVPTPAASVNSTRVEAVIVILVFALIALPTWLVAAYCSTDDKARKTTIYECLLVVIISVIGFGIAVAIAFFVGWAYWSVMGAITSAVLY